MQFEFLENKNIYEILRKLPFGTAQTELEISDQKWMIFTCKHESIDNFRNKMGIFVALQRQNLVKRITKTIIAFAVSTLIYIWSLKMIEAQLVEILTKTSRKKCLKSWPWGLWPELLHDCMGPLAGIRNLIGKKGPSARICDLHGAFGRNCLFIVKNFFWKKKF